MYALTPGSIERDPNNIAVYLRDDLILSVQPIKEIFILESGAIQRNTAAVFPLTAFQTALILKSIWIDTEGNRENDAILFEVLQGTTTKFRLSVRERDSPIELPFLAVTPDQTLSITPNNDIEGVTVFAQQCYAIYQTM